jgi:hypothetical protein
MRANYEIKFQRQNARKWGWFADGRLANGWGLPKKFRQMLGRGTNHEVEEYSLDVEQSWGGVASKF